MRYSCGSVLLCSLAVLNLRDGHTMDILSPFICPLSFWLSLPRRDLSTSWCCPSRPCVVFLACVHLALFLALSISPGNSLVSSWCDHASFLALTVSNSSLFTPTLLRTYSFVFFAVHETRRIFFSPFISKASWRVSSFFLSVRVSQPYVATGHTSAVISCGSESKNFTPWVFLELFPQWLEVFNKFYTPAVCS